MEALEPFKRLPETWTVRNWETVVSKQEAFYFLPRDSVDRYMLIYLHIAEIGPQMGAEIQKSFRGTFNPALLSIRRLNNGMVCLFGPSCTGTIIQMLACTFAYDSAEAFASQKLMCSWCIYIYIKKKLEYCGKRSMFFVSHFRKWKWVFTACYFDDCLTDHEKN